ncbi:hypothetical protein JYT44_02480 [Caldithrix abyssi]|nr:hypothetical protein [Caldithrix abyssi]
MRNENQITDTEVKQKKSRKRITKEYNLKILQKYGSTMGTGEKGIGMSLKVCLSGATGHVGQELIKGLDSGSKCNI